MERRTGFAVAGAVTMILVAGAIAAGANLGLLGSSGRSGPAGQLRPTDAAIVSADQTPQVVTVEVKDPAAETTGQAALPGGSVQIVDVPAATSTAGGDDSNDDDDGFDDDDDEPEIEDVHESETDDSGHDDGSDSDD